MNLSFDAIVLGGGPAGLAAAAALGAKNLSVALLERARLGGPRVGETFGAELGPLLARLGLTTEFSALENVPFRGVRSAWGSSVAVERSSIVHPLGEGWHVDRAAFDAMLAKHAARAGVALHEDVGVVAVEPQERGFLFRTASGLELEGHTLVDASGRGAPGSAKGVPGRRWLAFDRMVALVARMAPPPGKTLDPELLIESAEEGWWYAVPQPGDRLLVTLLTDADLAAAGPREELQARWQAALARTTHTRALAEGSEFIDPPHIVRADTGCLLPSRGRGWIAIGDAAFGGDPLSGDGVVRALQSALEASDLIEEARLETDKAPSSPSVSEAFLSFLDRRTQYYRAEERFAEAPFWMRRQGFDWQEIPIALDPRKMLVWRGETPEPNAIAPLEALLPPRAIRAVLDFLARPRPAHEALAALREAAPLGDRRLLIGLQMLVEGDFIEFAGGSGREPSLR